VVAAYNSTLLPPSQVLGFGGSPCKEVKMHRQSHLTLQIAPGTILVASLILVVMSGCVMPSTPPATASIPTSTVADTSTSEPAATPTLPATTIAPTETAATPTPPAATMVPTETSTPSAQYQLTFEATWSAGTHPIDFPPNPHFSDLIGATHSAAAHLWEEGGTATPGIENMAETGAKSPLDSEIDSLIGGGSACAKISGGGINPSPGVVTVTFIATQDCPLVSVVSMIAPSPDWFVGVTGLSLYEDGKWVEQKAVELYPYDAGTDSGSNYTSPDVPTGSPEAIHRIEAEPLLLEGTVPPLGTFTFTRLDD